MEWEGPGSGEYYFITSGDAGGSVSGAGQSVGTPDHTCHPQTEKRGSAQH